MPRPKVSDADFIDFLIATPKQATATEAVRTQPRPADPRVAAAAHDAYTADRPEWVAADVGRVMELKNVRDSMADFEADERGVEPIYTPGGRQMVATVTEAGLYRLIFRSDKPAARGFQRWVMHDVLPSIRRHGCYPPPAPAPPLPLGAAINPGTALIPLGDVPSLPWLPRRPAVDTVYEWHRYGRRGVYLQTMRSGGRLYTSEAEVFIFLTRLASPNPRPDAPVTLTLNMDASRSFTLGPSPI